MFKIKTGYCLELLMYKTMNLLESTKSKITKNKKGENVSHLEITEVLLIHCNIVNSHMYEIFLQRYCMKWVPGDPLKEMIN